MDNSSSSYSVVIVGGGPVGLLLGIMLAEAGISCQILEKRATSSSDSRSFGIHPPSLTLLSKLGLAKPMIQEGICIRRGYAFANTKKVGSLSFESCPEPFNFILSLSQNRTEQILEHHLNQLQDQLLIRSAKVTNITPQKDSVFITYHNAGQEKTIEADFIVGCDGKESFVRNWTGIPFEGRRYPDTYVMGDFADNTTFGNDAAIFLCDEGVVESFPLPNNQRRWVVKTNKYCRSNQRAVIEETVTKRIQHDLSKTNHHMVSSFGVQKRIAQSIVKNRIILAGDAAHLVSPIGGQGMNLGWLGVQDLAHCLDSILTQGADLDSTLQNFEKRRRKVFRNVVRRSEFNMQLGRKVSHSFLRNLLVSIMLKPPLSKLMARLFAMHGIEKWII